MQSPAKREYPFSPFLALNSSRCSWASELREVRDLFEQARRAPDPLLFILHVGYSWVVAGTALLGLSLFNVGVPTASAIHALTVGAIAVMILAVMPRVTLGHTGRRLTANRATVIVFVLINLAAITRVYASWHPAFMTMLLFIASGFWIAAFALFEIVYGPMLLTRNPARAGPPP